MVPSPVQEDMSYETPIGMLTVDSVIGLERLTDNRDVYTSLLIKKKLNNFLYRNFIRVTISVGIFMCIT